jgi:hypothetical protein
VFAEECLHVRIEAQEVVAEGSRGFGPLFERLPGVGPQRIKCRLALALYRIAPGRSCVGPGIRGGDQIQDTKLLQRVCRWTAGPRKCN